MKKPTRPKAASMKKKTTKPKAAGRVESNRALKPLVVDKTKVNKLNGL